MVFLAHSLFSMPYLAETCAAAGQALDATLASEAEARRDVAQALAAREERAARAYVEKLEREAARLAELAGEQQRLKESQIQ